MAAYPGYLLTFNDDGFRTPDAGHVFLGGQPQPFSLKGQRGESWPSAGETKPDKQMRIPAGYTSGHIPADGSVPTRLRAQVVRTAKVAGTPALVLRVSLKYPAGGVHSGHVLAVWNRGGFGYLVSLHFRGGTGRFQYTEAERVQTALKIARSSRPVPASRR